MSEDEKDKVANNSAKEATKDAPKDAADRQGPPYQIVMQYVKDLSFENPKAPEVFKGEGQINTKIGIDVETKTLGGRDVEIILKMEVKAHKQDDEQLLYSIDILYGGIARIGDVPKEAVGSLLMIELPSLLYPFMRAVMLNTIRDGGFPAPNLPPINFVALARQKAQQMQDANAKDKATADSTEAKADDKTIN